MKEGNYLVSENNRSRGKGLKLRTGDLRLQKALHGAIRWSYMYLKKVGKGVFPFLKSFY